MKSTITPCLWFDGDAEEAAELYTRIFPDSRIDHVSRAAADNPSGKKGDVLTVAFTMGGRPFIGLNGGPDFPFTEAVSFSIDCEDQAEVDEYWDALIAGGGSPSVCGLVAACIRVRVSGKRTTPIAAVNASVEPPSTSTAVTMSSALIATSVRRGTWRCRAPGIARH